MSTAEASSSNATHSLGWLLHYALRRFGDMLIVLLAMLLKIGLDLLKPWPMKVLIDHVLKQEGGSQLIERWIHHLGDPSRQRGDLVCRRDGRDLRHRLGADRGLRDGECQSRSAACV